MFEGINIGLAVAGALAAIGVVGLCLVILRFANRSARRLRADPKASAKVLREWLPTGRIDFVGDWEEIERNDVAPVAMTLRIEETRVVETFSGGLAVERRWRLPMLNEVRSVVKRYRCFLEEHTDAWVSGDDPKATKSVFDAEPISLAGRRTAA